MYICFCISGSLNMVMFHVSVPLFLILFLGLSNYLSLYFYPCYSIFINLYLFLFLPFSNSNFSSLFVSPLFFFQFRFLCIVYVQCIHHSIFRFKLFCFFLNLYSVTKKNLFIYLLFQHTL